MSILCRWKNKLIWCILSIPFTLVFILGIYLLSTVNCKLSTEFYQVAGISMEPTLHEGDIVKVVSGEWKDGDIVIADTGDRLIVKRVVGDKLIGDNRGYTAIYNIADVKIIGKAEKVDKQISDTQLEKVWAYLEFDGIDDYVSVPNTASIQVTGDMTVEFWLKPTNVGTQRLNPIGKAYGGEFFLTIETNGSLNYYHGSSGGNTEPYIGRTLFPAGTFQNGIRNHYAIVRTMSDRTIRSYKDGVLISTVTWSATEPNPSPSAYNLVMMLGYTGYALGGDLSEVRIWNISRTQAQIQENMNKTLTGTEPGLVGYWKLNETSGTTAYDTTSNGNNGIVYGGTWISKLNTITLPKPSIDVSGYAIKFSNCSLTNINNLYSTIKYSFDNGSVQTVSTTPASPLQNGSLFSFSISTSGLTDGEHTLKVWSVDTHNQESEKYSYYVTVTSGKPEKVEDAASFIRSSKAYKTDGTSVDNNVVRYETGKNGQGMIVEEGSLYLSYSMSTGGNNYLYVDITNVTDYVVQAGDYLEYDVFWPTNVPTVKKIAVDLTTTDGTNLRDSGAVDQNGLNAHPSADISTYASGKWYHRKIALPASLVGKTIAYYDLVCEYDNGGVVAGLIRNIKITDGAGTTRKSIWSSGNALPTFAVHLTSKTAQTYNFSKVKAEILTVPTANKLNPQEGTISAWVNINDSIQDTNTNHYIFSTSSDPRTNTNTLALFHSSTSNCWRFWTRDQSNGENYVDIPNLTNGWHHIVVRWTSGEKTIFVDGEKITLANNPKLPLYFDQPLYIGSWFGIENANTVIDDFRVYKRALSDQEIAASYTNGALAVGCTVNLTFDNTLKSIPNTNPSITLTSPPSGQTYTQQTDKLPIEGTVRDEKNETIEIWYRIKNASGTTVVSDTLVGTCNILANTDTNFSFTGANGVSLIPIKTAGSYIIEVWAKDPDEGVSNVKTQTFNVYINQSPVISITSPSEDKTYSVAAGQNIITISGKVSDPEGDSVTISAAIDGKIKSIVVSPVPTTLPSSDNWTLTWNITNDKIRGGSYNIAITANDGYNTASVLTKTITVIVPDTASPVNYRWNPLSKGPGETLNNSLLLSTADKIFVIGGQDKNGINVPRLYVYDIKNKTWFDYSDKGIYAREFSCGAVSNGKLYVITNATSGMVVYDPLTNTKTTIPAASNPSSDTDREYATLTTVYGKLYLIGGLQIRDDINSIDSTIWRFDTSTSSWSMLKSNMTIAGHYAFNVGGKIYIFGGRNKEQSLANQVLEWNPETGETVVKTSSPISLDKITDPGWHGTVVNGKVYFRKGSTTYIYSPANNTWDWIEKTEPTDTLTNWVTITGVFTPGEMISSSGTGTEMVLNNENFSDVQITASIYFIDGAKKIYLPFRSSEDGINKYYLEIKPDRLTLYKNSLAGFSGGVELQSVTRSVYAEAYALHTYNIVLLGSTIGIWEDGIPRIVLQDSTYGGGKIGFGTQDTKGGLKDFHLQKINENTYTDKNELVKNGEFDTNLNDWTSVNGDPTTIKWVNGRLMIVTPGGTGDRYVKQDVPIGDAKVVLLRGKIRGFNASQDVKIQYRWKKDVTPITDYTIAGSVKGDAQKEVSVILLVPQEANILELNLGVQSDSSPTGYGEFDRISVKQVTPDTDSVESNRGNGVGLVSSNGRLYQYGGIKEPEGTTDFYECKTELSSPKEPSLIDYFLSLGGNVVWAGNTPFKNLSDNILGFKPINQSVESTVTLTQEGKDYGLTGTWGSKLPVPANKVNSVLAKTENGNSAGWKKVWNTKEPLKYVIRDWLVLGPIDITGKINEENIEPFAGLKTATGSVSGEKVWEEYGNNGDKVDFKAKYGSGTGKTAYAATYVYSSITQNAKLKITSKNNVNAWVNGKKVAIGNKIFKQSEPVDILPGSVLDMNFKNIDGTTVKDNSGYNNNGTVYGATQVDGQWGKCLSFDGIDDYVEVPYSNSLDLTDKFTVEVWIKADRIPQNNNINIKVASSGLEDSPRDSYVYVGGVLRHTTTRSWAVTKLDQNWNWIETRQFDCFGDYNQAVAMKNYLESLPKGTIVIINTYDEPRNNVYNNTELITQLEAFGATRSIIQNLDYRSSYLLVGQKGLGPGNAFVEKYGPRYGKSIYCDNNDLHIGDIILKENSYGLRVKDSNIKGMINNNYISCSMVQNEWTHIVLTYDGKQGSLYKNGMLAASVDISAPTQNKNPLLIGGLGSFYFPGQIAHVAVYNRALTAEEIKKRYESYFEDFTETDITLAKGLNRILLRVDGDASSWDAITEIIPTNPQTITRQIKDPATGEDMNDKYIKKWLLCGPFYNGSWDENQINVDFIGETSITPTEGMVTNGKTWTSYTTPRVDGIVDLAGIYGATSGGTNCRIYYGYATIYSEDFQDAKIKVGADDRIKVWVNGVEVYNGYGQWTDEINPSVWGGVIDVPLKKGENKILVKVYDWGGGFWFKARVATIDPIAPYIKIIPNHPEGQLARIYDTSVDGNNITFQQDIEALTNNLQENKIVYYDTEGYTWTSWIRNHPSLKDFLVNNGFKVKGARELKAWMLDRINSKTAGGTVVVFARDSVPETIAETKDQNCTLRRYLNAGGKVVWLGEVQMAYRAKFAGDEWWDGSESVLGIRWLSTNYTEVTLTDTAASMGLTGTWKSIRPVYPGQGVTALAVTPDGNIAGWIKNYNPKYPYSGFVRLYDLPFDVSDEIKNNVLKVALYGLNNTAVYYDSKQVSDWISNSSNLAEYLKSKGFQEVHSDQVDYLQSRIASGEVGATKLVFSQDVVPDSMIRDAVDVKVTESTATITWVDNTKGETQYNIYVNGINKRTIYSDTVEETGRSYTVTIDGLELDTTYKVEIKPVYYNYTEPISQTNEGMGLSITFTTLPIQKPLNFRGKVFPWNEALNRTVELSWEDGSMNETGFEVYIDGVLKQTVPSTTKETTSTTYTLRLDVDNGKTYKFGVKAIAGDKKSEMVETTVLTLPANVRTVRQIEAGNLSDTWSKEPGRAYAVIEWDPSPGAESYGIWIFDGYTYRKVQEVTTTRWDSREAKIYPPEEELDKYPDNGIPTSVNPFKTPGTGLDLRDTPTKLYVKTSGTTYDTARQYWIRINAKNSAGETTYSTNGYYPTFANRTDTTPPTGAISINDGAKATTSLTVRVSMLVSDADSGCDTVEFSFDGTTWTPKYPFASTMNLTLPEGLGEKVVYARVTDKVGNSAIFIDGIEVVPEDQPPTISIAINGGQANTTSTSVKINVNVSDDLTPTNKLYVRFSNDNITWSSWMQCTTTQFNWTLTSGDGPKFVIAQVKDERGNVAEAVGYINLITGSGGGTGIISNDSGDVKTITVNGITYPALNKRTFEIKIGNPVNISEISVSFDGVTWSPWERAVIETLEGGGTALKKKLNFPGNEGWNEVYLRFKTTSGGISNIISQKFLIDTKPPVVKLQTAYGSAATSSSQIDIIVDVDDNVSEAFTYVYSINDGAFTSPVNLPATKRVTVNGIQKGKLNLVQIKVYDQAGNSTLSSIRIWGL